MAASVAMPRAKARAPTPNKARPLEWVKGESSQHLTERPDRAHRPQTGGRLGRLHRPAHPPRDRAPTRSAALLTARARSLVQRSSSGPSFRDQAGEKRDAVVLDGAETGEGPPERFGRSARARRGAQRSQPFRKKRVDPGWNLLSVPRVVLTFGLAMIGWVFFRAADLRQSALVISQMFSGSAGHLLLQPWHIELALLSLGIAIAEEMTEWSEKLIAAPVPVFALSLAMMLFCTEIFDAIDSSIPFIYFQF